MTPQLSDSQLGTQICDSPVSPSSPSVVKQVQRDQMEPAEKPAANADTYPLQPDLDKKSESHKDLLYPVRDTICGDIPLVDPDILCRPRRGRFCHVYSEKLIE